MKTLQQLSLFLENKPGALAAPLQALGDAGFNLYSLCLADTQSFGVLRLLVRDPEAAARVLAEKGIASRLTDVVAIQVDDHPGELSKVLAVLDRHGINVEYMYAFVSARLGRAALVFRFQDPADALSKIGGELTLLDAEALLG